MNPDMQNYEKNHILLFFNIPMFNMSNFLVANVSSGLIFKMHVCLLLKVLKKKIFALLSKAPPILALMKSQDA